MTRDCRRNGSSVRQALPCPHQPWEDLCNPVYLLSSPLVNKSISPPPLLYMQMKTLRLDQAYPGDSIKVMWWDSDRATATGPRDPQDSLLQGSALCPSHLFLGVNTDGWLSVCPAGAGRIFLHREVNKEAFWGQQRTTHWRPKSQCGLSIFRSSEHKTQKAPRNIPKGQSPGY